MILADTSVWIQHFRRSLPGLEVALNRGGIVMHVIVLGELATGNLSRRAYTLGALRRLPQATAGTADECLAFIEIHRLYGRGIGWNDVQMLVAARLSGCLLWSLDQRLAAAAAELDMAHVAL